MLTHPAAAVALNVGDADATLVNDGRTLVGRRATFAFDAAATTFPVALRTDLYVFANADGRHRWAVEYRFTYDAAASAQPAIARFMADLPLRFGP